MASRISMLHAVTPLCKLPNIFLIYAPLLFIYAQEIVIEKLLEDFDLNGDGAVELEEFIGKYNDGNDLPGLWMSDCGWNSLYCTSCICMRCPGYLIGQLSVMSRIMKLYKVNGVSDKKNWSINQFK